MRSFLSGILFHALLVLVLLSKAAADADAASCTDYTKGKFGPETIASFDICEDACQTAEGLPVGRFKSEVNNSDYLKCTCLFIDNSGDSTTVRDLCQDGAPSGIGRVAAGLGLAVATTILVAFVSI